MKLGKTGLALGLASSITTGAHAENVNDASFNNWSKQNPEQANVILASSSTEQELAQKVIETGEVTKKQVQKLTSDMKKSKWQFGAKGSNNTLQSNASFIHNNFGFGVEALHSNNVDQLAFTGGLSLTPNESSALAKVVIDGQIKISLVESEVKNALADFDETGVGIEFIVNLKSALLKQVSLSHSQHELDLDESSSEFQVENSIDQTSLQLVFELTKNLDANIGYSRDSLGENLFSTQANYSLNDKWSIDASYEETRRFSGDEKQNISTLTANYTNRGLIGFAGLRHDGNNTSPYVGLQYAGSFGKTPKSPYNNYSNYQYPARSLTSTVKGASETHAHAISQVEAVIDNTKPDDRGMEEIISSPTLNSLGTVNINDNGGGLASTITVTGADIQQGAVFTLLTPTEGLSINSETGVLTFSDNIGGNQVFPNREVQVENPDGGWTTTTFNLNVTDNF